MAGDNLWLPQTYSEGQNRTQVFCLPHAGGGSAIYHRWEKLLPGHLAVVPIKLPGRESRFNETPHDNVDSLIAAMAPAIADAIQEPFALYGHSMGGLIAYEFAQHLLERYNRSPRALFVSASRSPDRFKQDRALHRLPDEEMIQSLIRDFGRGGETSAAELEMMRTMAVTIRADLKLLETYEHAEREPLPCPIIGIAATEDHGVTASDVNGWRAFTSDRFTMRTMPGQHFFLREQEKAITSLIASRLPPV